MKLLALMAAGAIAVGTVAAAPADAQHYRHGYYHGYGRHAGYGYRRHGYGWGHRGYGRCRVFYRHGYRDRRCY